MTQGRFIIDRRIFEHSVFQGPYGEVQAWIWMIGAAAWAPHRRRIAHIQVDLERGQLAASHRFLAEKWDWDKSRVARFISRLQSEAMIEAATEAGVTLITICNYDKYQFADVKSEAASEAAPMQERGKGEELKSSLFDNISTPARVSQPDDWPEDFREQFWQQYPNKVGKADALKKLELIRRKRLATWQQISQGLMNYVNKDDDRPWCNPATWLNQTRWLDEPAAKRAGNGPQRSGQRSFVDIARHGIGGENDEPTDN